MKFKITLAIASLLAVTGLCLMTPGCSTSLPVVAEKTETAANMGVTGAMIGWGAYVAAVHPGTNAETQVRNLFLTTQTAELAVIDATTTWALSSTTNAASLTVTPANLTAAQAALSNAQAELISTIASLTNSVSK